jgi:hypothetical protein
MEFCIGLVGLGPHHPVVSLRVGDGQVVRTGDHGPKQGNLEDKERS